MVSNERVDMKAKVILSIMVMLSAGLVRAAPGYNPPVTGWFFGGTSHTWTNTVFNERVALSSIMMTSEGNLGYTNAIWVTDPSGTNWHQLVASRIATNTLEYIDGTGGVPLPGGTNGKIRFDRAITNGNVRFVINTRTSP